MITFGGAKLIKNDHFSGVVVSVVAVVQPGNEEAKSHPAGKKSHGHKCVVGAIGL
jgi:hypothetical protein